MNFTRFDFPEGFLFGAATAAYQIEGSQFGGAGPSHWDSFAATPGNVVKAEGGAIACDHYHHWREDLDLLKEGNFDAYRFSTNWARVMPDGSNINQEGVDYYDRLVDGMLERGLKPSWTLYHWDLPSALADLGGWANRDTTARFADYAEMMARVIGDRVYNIATINEPWCVAWLSHFLGGHAPGLRDIRMAARAMHHILLAHGRAVERLRDVGIKSPIGIVLNFDHCTPASDRSEDKAAALRQDAIFNRWFIEAITRQTYPTEALEGLSPHLPQGWEEDMPLIGQKLDWLGVNYYTRHIQKACDGPWPSLTEIEGPLPKTQMGWEIYPDGLYHFLTRMARDYVGDLPIYVTENGMANADEITDEGISDQIRIDFINAHLSAMKQAIAEGVNLKGFFYWSLLDNYEWAEGYAKRFGIIHVDYETQKRSPKASYYMLQRMLARNQRV